ncbi:hypothetical protein Goarm_020096 [Gossypium armourianum]|uniref:DUF7745 domain-containing protein n=1 Tax=Gossypium armourianum TaxID=34283 RepID=A0A7J9IMH3_9ROSI|nr:hypothetical protein [Gossypium armourianum]
MKEIWDQWDDEVKQLFYFNYGDLSYLFDIKVDKNLFRALDQYWNPTYSCFTFGKVDLVPTVEDPNILKKADKHHGDERAVVAARIKQKRDNKCIPWRNLRDLILAHPDVKKRVDVFALSIYGLLIFSKALGHIDVAVSDLFDRLDKRVTPVPKELVATPRRNDITEEKWMMILQILQDEDVEWKALWMVPNEILYRCGDFDWVIPSELEIVKQDFERKSLEIEKRMKQLEEEKMQLGLDVDVQKLEAKKLRKGKNKAEEDLDGLKIDYKKLRRSMRTASPRKTSDQWRQEIKKEKSRVSRWERKFRDAQA